MPNINWNEEWEKLSPINVEDKVLIRAEFHEPNPAMEEIIIHRKCLSERDIIQQTFHDSANVGNGFSKTKKFWIWVGTSVLAFMPK